MLILWRRLELPLLDLICELINPSLSLASASEQQVVDRRRNIGAGLGERNPVQNLGGPIIERDLRSSITKHEISQPRIILLLVESADIATIVSNFLTPRIKWHFSTGLAVYDFEVGAIFLLIRNLGIKLASINLLFVPQLYFISEIAA